jgi:hypothetical protein
MQVLPMIRVHQIDVQGRMAVDEAGNPILIKLGDALRIPARAALQHSALAS